MSSISNSLSQFPDFHNLSSNTSNAPLAVKTQQLQAQAQTSTNTSLNFVTAEGDRVSLSTGSAITASLGTYTFQGLAEGQAVTLQSQQFNTSARSDFNLVIEGDLNEQEREDIKAFIKTAQDLLQELKTGDVEDVAEASLSLGELDSLASASLFFQQDTAVSLEARSTQLAIQGESPSQNARERGINSGPGNRQTIEKLFDKIQKAQEQFQIDPEHLSKRIPKILNKLVNTLEKPLSQGKSPRTFFDHIQKELLKSLLQPRKDRTTEPERTEELIEKARNPTLDDPSTVKNSGISDNLLNEAQDNRKNHG